MQYCELWRSCMRPVLLVLALLAPAQTFASCECPPGYFGEYQPACGPNGAIAFVTQNALPPIYELWTTVYAGPEFEFGCSCPADGPTWAPDGNRVAFFAAGVGIYIMTRGEPDPVSVPGTDGRDSAPAWSPQGGTIAFVRRSDVWAMNEDGSSRRQITYLGNCSAPAISPDGTQIAFAGGGSVWVQALDSSASPRRLTNGGHPAWAPNGNWIAFDSDRAGNLDVWVIAARGGTAVRITSSADSEGDPSWSSDGTKIVCTVTMPSCSCLEWVATLPDYTVGVQPCTWSKIKGVYR
jgi:Tol biopolymer transport system component